MPLTPSKIKHVAKNIRRIASGRTQQIALQLRKSDGSLESRVVDFIWKPAEDSDPTMVPPGGGVPGFVHLDQTADIVAISLQDDLSFTDLRRVAWAQPVNPIGGEVATRYILTSVTPKGMRPGGDRFITTWSRQR